MTDSDGDESDLDNDEFVSMNVEEQAEEFERNLDGQSLENQTFQFERDMRVGGYSTSTLNEFQRIWTHFVQFLSRHRALNVFLNDEGMPHLPLQKVPCVLFIKHLTLARRPVHDSDAEFRYLGPGTINNAIAALKYHGFGDQAIPHNLQLFFRSAAKAQARKVARERKQKGHHVASEGLTWPALKILLRYARCHDPDLHCFLVNLFQSISRGERVSDEQWVSLDWVLDHMTCHQITSKCDQAGQYSYPKQYFWSHDVDMCWVTALGRRILTTPPEQAGPYIYKDNTKDTAKAPVQRYERRLKALLQQMPSELKVQLGIPLDRITLHSIKRSAYRHLQAFPVDRAQLSIRAEHRTGLAFTYSARDIGANPNDDATMGRLLSGLKYRTDEFYVAPPHFGNPQNIPYDSIVPMHACMQASGLKKTIQQFNKVLPFVIAAVVHHYHRDNQGLKSNDQLFRSPLWATQVRVRNILYNQLKGGGREDSDIAVTGTCYEHENHMILLRINSQLEQQRCGPQLTQSGVASERNECHDPVQEPVPVATTSILSRSIGKGHRELLIQQTTTTTMFDLFVRYFVGIKGCVALRHLTTADIPRHLTNRERKLQRSLFSKMKYVFTAMLGQTNPECIDSNNAALIYGKLMQNISTCYGECVTQGCVRTAYNKLRKNRDAYNQCCEAPQVSTDPPRQMLIPQFAQRSFAQPGLANDDTASDASSILEIDDVDDSLDCCNVEKCMVCPYCDDDVMYTFKTRKTLLEHIRSSHPDLPTPHPNLVKEIDSQKDGTSANARWIRAPNAIARLPKLESSVSASPSSSKPANLASSIIQERGVRSGSFIEVYNSSSKDRWFLLVVDGRILGLDTSSPHLLSSHWCLPNSLEMDVSQREKVRVNLASIINKGDKDELARTLVSSSTGLPALQTCRRKISEFFRPVARLHPESVRDNTHHAGASEGGGDADADGDIDCNGASCHHAGAPEGGGDDDDHGDGDGDGGSNHEEVDDALEKMHDEFQRRASKMNIVHNDGNGDCLFLALVQGVVGLEKSASDLRHEVVRHARNNMKQFYRCRGRMALRLSALVSHSGVVITRSGDKTYHNLPQYFSYMNSDGTWGEELEIASAATFLNACIHVYSPNRNDHQFQYFASNSGSVNLVHIYLRNKDGRSHYELLKTDNNATCTPPTVRKRGREACIVPIPVFEDLHLSSLDQDGLCVQHGGYRLGDKDNCSLCKAGRRDLYIRNGVCGHEDSPCTRGQCAGNGAPDCERCQDIVDRNQNQRSEDQCVIIHGQPGLTNATEAQTLQWWGEAVAACDMVQQDPESYAWTHFVKHSDKDRQNGSLHPNGFRALLQETVNQLGAGSGFNFLDLGSEAGMALLHFMLHPSIGQVTGIEIDPFWFSVSIQLLNHVASCARLANVHVASIVLIREDFLNENPQVTAAMAEADIVYANNVQFDKKSKGIPKRQRALPDKNPFKAMVNPNLAAKFFAITQRDRVVLALFEYAAFESKLAKKVQSMQLQPTWGNSTAEVALLLYLRHKQSDTPKRLRPQKQHDLPKPPKPRRDEGICKQHVRGRNRSSKRRL
jgi:hypothetical protein